MEAAILHCALQPLAAAQTFVKLLQEPAQLPPLHLVSKGICARGVLLESRKGKPLPSPKSLAVRRDR